MAFIIRCDGYIDRPMYVSVPDDAERLSPTAFSKSFELVNEDRVTRFADRELAKRICALMKAHRGPYTFTVVELPATQN